MIRDRGTPHQRTAMVARHKQLQMLVTKIDKKNDKKCHSSDVYLTIGYCFEPNQITIN
jgi:hypothetical protein